jgi:hypothetical protein
MRLTGDEVLDDVKVTGVANAQNVPEVAVMFEKSATARMRV